VIVGVAVLTPLLAWLGPLGFAPLMGLAGLLCLPAFRLTDEDRPVAIVLLAGLVWAAVTTAWSPYRPDDLDRSVALKLALQLPLYWSAWCGARRAAPALRRLALSILAWGLAAVGVLMLAEAATGGAIYQGLRTAIGDPIRPDLAGKNLAQGTFVLAVLWPVAAAGGMRAGRPWALGLPMALGTGAAALVFLADAPVLAVGLSLLVGAAAWTWSRSAPRGLGVAAAAYVLLAPAVTLGVRAVARSLGLHVEAPASWAQRMDYWSHAVDFIAEHPLRGWGLDASRAFSPAIQLHPHNGSLQLWLELGAPGAILAALFWLFLLRRLSRERPDLATAAGAASATAYLVFAAVNFGVWQEWWLALGALAAVVVGLMDGADLTPARAADRRSAAKSSTSAGFSG